MYKSTEIQLLTHGGQRKISQTTFSNAFFLQEIFGISIQISLEFVPKDQNDNGSGDGSVLLFPKTMLTMFFV